ncbi:hypothetical protein K469DRAFT_767959 [Zopfia rhizophila CBS 207.26]|uniref:Uncharacterized protein n=1 Tax=Zopfia rhizophila CBS 207.26 TaxID=1314779 RepID=A0A6A6E9Y9_9PEZI|nr:hypothetical protein K469DRAFT_767959 [Zopfia rhizophila CBS 207.26]
MITQVNQISTKDITSVKDLLTEASPVESTEIKGVLSSSYDMSTDPSCGQHPRVGSRNSLVYTALKAYFGHHHLRNSASFINKSAERMRQIFVEHEGQKQLQRMKLLAGQIQENIQTPGLKEWILPNFTTTTDTDGQVASTMMVGAVQSYFKYHMVIVCGLSAVTLLGEKDDYEDMLERLEYLESLKLGEDVDRCRYSSRLCGANGRLSGWLAAFWFFNNKGWVQIYPAEAEYSISYDADDRWNKRVAERQCVPEFNYEVDIGDIPSALVSMPVAIGEGGPEDDDVVKCTLFAGVGRMGYKDCVGTVKERAQNGDARDGGDGELYAVQLLTR